MGSRLLKIFEPMARDIPMTKRFVFRPISILCCSLVTMTVLGCGGIKYVPVSGQVKLDGKPVSGCAVLFVPTAGGPAASATTDADGRFQLAAANRPGVPEGEYSVTLTKQNTNDVRDPATGNRHLQIEWLTPQKYSRPETSGICKMVSDQEHEFMFELTSK